LIAVVASVLAATTLWWWRNVNGNIRPPA
jgi:hypothetical protein